MAGTKSYGYLRDTNKDFHVLVHRLAHRHVILSGGGTTTLVEGDSGALCVFDAAAVTLTKNGNQGRVNVVPDLTANSTYTVPAPAGAGEWYKFIYSCINMKKL